MVTRILLLTSSSDILLLGLDVFTRRNSCWNWSPNWLIFYATALCRCYIFQQSRSEEKPTLGSHGNNNNLSFFLILNKTPGIFLRFLLHVHFLVDFVKLSRDILYFLFRHLDIISVYFCEVILLFKKTAKARNLRSAQIIFARLDRQSAYVIHSG